MIDPSVEAPEVLVEAASLLTPVEWMIVAQFYKSQMDESEAMEGAA